MVVSAFARPPGRPLELGTRPFPGRTCGQNMLPWWSVESKSLEDSAITTPWRHAYSTAWRMKVV